MDKLKLYYFESYLLKQFPEILILCNSFNPSSSTQLSQLFLLCFTSFYYICQQKASLCRVFKKPHNLKYYKKDTIFWNMNSLELRLEYKGKILTISTVPIIFLTGCSVKDCTMTLYNQCVVHQRGTAFGYCLAILLQAPFTAQSIFPTNKNDNMYCLFQLNLYPKVFHFIKLTSISHLFHHMPELWYEKDWNLKPIVSQQGHLQYFPLFCPQ